MFLSAVSPQLTVLPNIRGRSGESMDNADATIGKQQSTNAQQQQRMSDDHRMRWRTTAAEEMWWMKSNKGMATDKQLWFVAEEQQWH
jgi:hypothetical protein